MTLTSLAVIMWIILIISMVHEPRNFWNAILVIFNIGLTMVAAAMKPGIWASLLGIFIMLIPVLFLLTALFLIINGIIMIKKESKTLANMLSLIMGVGMIMASVATIIGLYYFQDMSLIRAIFYLVLMLEFYVAVTFAGLFTYSLMYTYIPKRLDCDYIIVHGCGLTDGERVSPLLKGRVDKAVKIYNKCSKENGKLKIVLSGGRGVDEKISEAQAMNNYLIETGFKQGNIILEEESKTTYENLENVRDMLDIDGRKNKYIFVTNNYHVFRTSLFARKLKMKAAGVGCKTAGYYWPSAFIREYIAIMVKYKWVFVFIILLWMLVELLI